MDPVIQVGHQAQYEATVTEAMRPVFDGEVIHDVCSTWSMGECMEIAARRVLAPHLEDHEEGVGTHLSIDHLAPAPVGETIITTATATDIDSRSVTCDVQVHCNGTLVASGVQIQRVLPRSILRQRLPGAR